MATVIMSEMLSNAPFEEYGLGENDFVPINEMVGKRVEFAEVKEFENLKGPGIYLLFKDGDGYKYTTTHSGALISIFARDDMKSALAKGDTLLGTIVQRKSKTTGNNYFAVE